MSSANQLVLYNPNPAYSTKIFRIVRQFLSTLSDKLPSSASYWLRKVHLLAIIIAFGLTVPPMAKLGSIVMRLFCLVIIEFVRLTTSPIVILPCMLLAMLVLSLVPCLVLGGTILILSDCPHCVKEGARPDLASKGHNFALKHQEEFDIARAVGLAIIRYRQDRRYGPQ